MAKAARMVVGITCGLMLAAAAGCGGGVETSAPAVTTTTLSVDDQRLAGEFATAMQRLLRLRQLPAVSADDARCAGGAVVEAVGLERLRDAGLTPSEVTSIDHLADGGVELSEDEITALGDSISACLPDELGAGFADALGVPPTAVLATCMSDAITAALADGLARQVATGVEGFDTVGFAEGQVAGIRCRWKSQPEVASSRVTLDDGVEALEDALIEELSTPPPDLGLPSLARDELDCFVPTVIDALGEADLADSGATARELARYLSGEGPEAIALVISGDQAEVLAREYLDCVEQEALLRVQLEVAGVPENAIEPILACIVDRLPEDSLFDNLALNFEFGAAGQATARGEAILEEQAQAGFECAQEFQSTTAS